MVADIVVDDVVEAADVVVRAVVVVIGDSVVLALKLSETSNKSNMTAILLSIFTMIGQFWTGRMNAIRHLL